MKRVVQKILVLLKRKYWGVGFEKDLPPEFNITNHAVGRLKQRVGGEEKTYPELVIDIWYEGANAEESFNTKLEGRHKHMGKYFQNFVYKQMGNKIWVFGLKYQKSIGCMQKSLITVYDWKKSKSNG